MNKAWAMCERLADRGVLFVLETPWNCYSLKLAAGVQVLARPDVWKVKVCYCRLGRPCRKATPLVPNWTSLRELGCERECQERHAEVLMFAATAAAARYPELLCAGVTRLMLRDGIGCSPGTPAPRWMPRLPWVEARLEEIAAVGELDPACLDDVSGGGLVAEGDGSAMTDGLRRTRAALLAAQRADPWCQRLMQVVAWSAGGGLTLDAMGLQIAELEKLRRQAPEFELAADGVLHKKLGEAPVMGAPTSVPVLPPSGCVPRELAGEPDDGRWTWRRWALLQAHSSLPGGHLKPEKALR